MERLPEPMLSSGILREPCDRVVFETRDVVAGQFRCPTSYPDFRNAGRINHHVVVFPRSAVWIEREHERRFVADPGLATIYNPGQPYERSPISPEGDLADWLGVSERLARDVVRQFDPAHSEQEVPFLHVRAAIGHDVYLAQRTLFTDLVRSDIDALEIEQQVLEILGAVIAAAYRTKNTVNPARPRRGRPRRELVENARAVIAAHLFENLGVCELAAEVGVSPYHLCRAFHAESGMTLHEYRRHIRLRMALGLTAEYRGNLSALALRAGFYSHSHFTTAYRRAFGVSPSEGLPA